MYWLLLLLVYSGQSSGQSPDLQQHSLGLGAYYSRGDYGEPESTEIRYFPFSYSVDYGNWGVQLLLPRLEVTGLGNVLINVGGITRAVAGTERETSRGLGDGIASLVYHMAPAAPAAPFIDWRINIKLPTADEKKGLGTGETDFSLQMDLSQNAGNNVLFATIGRNFRGKTELFPGLKHSSFLQLGIARPITARWNMGVFYDYRQRASVFADESHELVPYASWQISDRWSVTGLLSKGFTQASPDYSVMGQLNYRW